MACEAEQKRMAGEVTGEVKGGQVVRINGLSKCSCNNIFIFILFIQCILLSTPLSVILLPKPEVCQKTR